ncbi:MAG: hypothetical protein ACREQ8_05615 [Woeseiaceae bacterium]
MQYMFLCCINEDHWERLDGTERDAVMQVRLEAKREAVETALLREATGRQVLMAAGA